MGAESAPPSLKQHPDNPIWEQELKIMFNIQVSKKKSFEADFADVVHLRQREGILISVDVSVSFSDLNMMTFKINMIEA